MGNLSKEPTKYASYVIVILGALFALYIFLNYAFVPLLPFLIAYMIALMVRPIADAVNRKTKISVRLLRVIFLLIILALLGFALTLLFNRGIYEIRELTTRLAEDSTPITDFFDKISDWIKNFRENNAWLSSLTGAQNTMSIDFEEVLSSVIKSASSALASGLPNMAGGVLRFFPNFLLFTVALIIAAFYFCLDLERVHSGILSVLPKKAGDVLLTVKRGVIKTLAGYIRAYALILSITFCELLVGFLILGVDYALTLAIIIAFVDILPVLGVGTVLIPWGLIALINGEVTFGFGMLIMYVIILVIRQLIEPKIVGDSLGLHPLITLAAIYVGFKLFGFVGIFLGLIAGLLIKSWLDTKNKREAAAAAQVETKPKK